MIPKKKMDGNSEEQIDGLSRKDLNTAGFREVHQRFYPKVYDYSFCQERNQKVAAKLTNSYFVKIARTMTDMEEPEQVVRGMSSKLLEAREATKKS